LSSVTFTAPDDRKLSTATFALNIGMLAGGFFARAVGAAEDARGAADSDAASAGWRSVEEAPRGDTGTEFAWIELSTAAS
jgi:hypothetical protein